MNDRLRVLVDYLLKRTVAAEVNPREIDAKALPYLFILEIERDSGGKTNRLRIRFAGTALDSAFQRKLVGRYLEDFVHGPRAPEVVAGFHACADTGQALWMRQVVHIVERAPRFVEGVAVRLPPDRVYGGLMVGDLATDEQSRFESQPLN